MTITAEVAIKKCYETLKKANRRVDRAFKRYAKILKPIYYFGYCGMPASLFDRVFWVTISAGGKTSYEIREYASHFLHVKSAADIFRIDTRNGNLPYVKTLDGQKVFLPDYVNMKNSTLKTLDGVNICEAETELESAFDDRDTIIYELEKLTGVIFYD